MRFRLGISVLATAGLAALLTPEAEANQVDSYCMGDGGRPEQGISYCYSVNDKGGPLRLKIMSFTFGGSYAICVDPPRGREVCDDFELEGKGEVRLDSVSLGGHFPSRAKGEYEVTWKRGGHELGPALHFVRR